MVAGGVPPRASLRQGRLARAARHRDHRRRPALRERHSRRRAHRAPRAALDEGDHRRGRDVPARRLEQQRAGLHDVQLPWLRHGHRRGGDHRHRPRHRVDDGAEPRLNARDGHPFRPGQQPVALGRYAHLRRRHGRHRARDFSQSATGGGTLWDRSKFAAINVVGASGDSIQFTYTATLSSGG
jgi:hypothetical protein